jgi:hypothetical protein
MSQEKSTGQKNWEQWISFWVGYVEEANHEIDMLTGKRSALMRERLQAAKQARDKGLKKIEELGGTADLILRR